MPTKTEIGVGVGIALLLLAESKKSSAATLANLDKKDADLLKRANQGRAREWVQILIDDLGIPEDQAAAEARWFGIESSGDPLSVSSEGERGLAQITKTSALKDGWLSQAEWDAMANVTTSDQEQARIAIEVIAAAYERAAKYLKVPPIDPIEHLFYAKLYHQRPVDVRDGKLTGNAYADSARLEKDWANDPTKLHYLHAANVVAWGSLHAPEGPTS